MKGRRKRLQLNKIQKDDGDWVKYSNLITDEAIKCFQDQFTQKEKGANFGLLNYIPEIVTGEDNMILNAFPTMEQVGLAVFSLNESSTSGPDDFTGLFYQQCWDIIGEEVLKIVESFCEGNTLPKSITYTKSVFIPKKEWMGFVYLRPISLSNFINKIISRVIHDRLERLLPKLISSN